MALLRCAPLGILVATLAACSGADVPLPPGPVTRLQALARGGAIALSWKNPGQPFGSVTVRRSVDGFPGTPSEGDAVYEGVAETFLDTGVTIGTSYYYSAFAQSSLKLWPSAAQALVLAQAPGELDVTFNGSGYVTDPGAAMATDASDLAVDGEGRAVVVGQIGLGGAVEARQAIWRFDSEGNLDTSFAGSGLIIYPELRGGSDVELDRDRAFGVEVDAAGRVFVTGTSAGIYVLECFGADGRIDGNYGAPSNAGVLFFQDRYLQDIAIDAQGRVLLLTVSNASNLIRVERLTPAGVHDSTFGNNGVINAPVVPLLTLAARITVDSSGRIIVLGSGHFVTAPGMTLWRVTPEGITDLAFGQQGLLHYAESPQTPSAADVAADATGKLRLIGVSTSSYVFTVWGYAADSTPDAAWGAGGIVLHGGDGYPSGEVLTVDAQGRVVVGGNISSLTHEARDSALWRFLPDGTPDSSFGTAGFVPYRDLVNVLGSTDIRGIRIDPQGRVVAVGAANTDRMFVLRAIP